MGRFKGKVAVVTGASAGIGAATAKALAEAGLIVVGIARRKERVKALAERLNTNAEKLYAVRADMTKEEDILQAFKWISDNIGSVHVLVNNAGLVGNTELIDGDTTKWKAAIDTNLLGLTIATREAIKIMRANNIDGHIININSVFGHNVPNLPGVNIYPATKHAVTALTETLRLELIRLGSKIKVTSLSPGLVETEIFEANDFSFEKFKETFKYPPLQSEDIANAVMYVINTPPHVQVTELTIRPVGEII